MDKKKIIWNGFSELGKEVRTVRFAASLFLIVGLVASMSTGIGTFINDTGEKIGPWMAPHFFSKYDFLGMYGLVICYMYSGIPYMNYSELPSIFRKKRSTWCSEKIFTIVSMGFLITLFTFIMTIVVFIPNVQYSKDWGRIIYSMAHSSLIVNYDIYGVAYAKLINEYTPIEAMKTCFIMVWAVTTLIGLLMFCFSLYINRTAGIIAAVVMVALEYARNPLLRRIMGFVAPFNWCNLNSYGSATWGIYLATLENYIPICLGCYIVILAAIAIRLRKIEFNFYKED